MVVVWVFLVFVSVGVFCGFVVVVVWLVCLFAFGFCFRFLGFF